MKKQKTSRAGLLAIVWAAGAASPAAWGSTHTWIGGNNSWGFIGATTADAVWTGNGGGVNVPPNTTSAEVFLGSTGSVNLGGGSWAVAYMHLGQSGPNFPGTGWLNVDNGTLTFAQNLYLGDGQAGTLAISGGQMELSVVGKHFYLGGGTISGAAGAAAWVDISAGTLLLNKTGIEKWTTNPAASTVNMTGGTVTFVPDDNANAITADTFNFTGGTINGLTKTTITTLSGSGVINLRNSGTTSVVVNQSIDTTFDGLIKSAGSSGSGGHGTISFIGSGNVTLGANAVLFVRDAYNFNGGIVKLGRNEQLGDGTNAGDGTVNVGAAGVLDLSGFTQTFKTIAGTGNISLGGGTLAANITSSTPIQFDGVISGSGTLTKGGAGQLILTGNHTSTGTTSISNGSLILQTAGTNNLSGFGSITVSGSGNLNVNGVAGGFALSSGQTVSNNGHVYGNVNVPSGSSIKGSGTFTDAVTVNGTIANNGSIGSTNFGSLSLNNASVNFELSSAGADKIIVNNANGLSLNGVSTIALKDLGGLSAGTYTLIGYNGTPLSDTGKLTLASTTLSGFTLQLLYNSLSANSIDLAVTGGGVTGSSWNFNGDGNYSDSTKWDGGVPNAVDAVANLNTHAGSITAPTVTITLDQNATLGTLNFDHATSSYTLAASGTNSLTMDVSSGQAAINVISGNHTIGAPVTLNKDMTITVTPAGNTLTITGAISSAGKAITKAGAGTVQVENIRAGTLSVTSGTVKVREKVGTPNSNPGTSVVSTLSITTGAVDLTNNAMVVNYSTLGTLLADTRQELFDGRLKTSLTSGGHALGYADNAQLLRSTFGGVSVGTNSVLIGHTFAGDANLDGRVNALDFNALATNFGNISGKTWVQGDSNYDGLVNTTDFTALGQTFGQSLPASPAAALGSLVPEPATLTFLPLLMAISTRRRRGGITKRG